MPDASETHRTKCDTLLSAAVNRVDAVDNLTRRRASYHLGYSPAQLQDVQIQGSLVSPDQEAHTEERSAQAGGRQTGATGAADWIEMAWVPLPSPGTTALLATPGRTRTGRDTRLGPSANLPTGQEPFPNIFSMPNHPLNSLSLLAPAGRPVLLGTAGVRGRSTNETTCIASDLGLPAAGGEVPPCTPSQSGRRHQPTPPPTPPSFLSTLPTTHPVVPLALDSIC